MNRENLLSELDRIERDLKSQTSGSASKEPITRGEVASALAGVIAIVRKVVAD